MRHAPTSALAALALVVALGAAGCSKHDNADVGQDLKNTGSDISHEASKVAHDPDVKSAESNLKAAGHDIAQDVKQAGAAAKSSAHDVAGDAKRAGHDVTHDTKSDRDTKSGDNS